MATKEYLEANETSLIEDQAKCLQDKLLIRLLRRMGCRVSEVLGIEDVHVNFARHEIRIEHEKARIALYCPECGSRLSKKDKFCAECTAPVKNVIRKATDVKNLRKVPVDLDTLNLITEYIREGGIKEERGRRYLFRMSRQWAWHIVKDCAERAGFNELINPQNEKVHHVSPHKFRDAFAINAMKKKGSMDDARILQEILGHKDIGTTLKYRKVASQEVHDFYNEITGETKVEQTPPATPKRPAAKNKNRRVAA